MTDLSTFVVQKNDSPVLRIILAEYKLNQNHLTPEEKHVILAKELITAMRFFDSNTVARDKEYASLLDTIDKLKKKLRKAKKAAKKPKKSKGKSSKITDRPVVCGNHEH